MQYFDNILDLLESLSITIYWGFYINQVLFCGLSVLSAFELNSIFECGILTLDWTDSLD
jgi:hypothetical protein